MKEIQARILEAQGQTKTEVYKFDVAAWSVKDQPFTIFHKSFTINDVSWVEKQSQGVKGDSLIYTIIKKSMDEEGKKLFTLADFNFLSKGVKSNVIVDIVNKLNAIDKDVDFRKE